MEREDSKSTTSETVNDNSRNSKRDFLSKIFITFGVVFAYGLLAFEGLFFVIPKRRKTDKIKIYGGRLKQYKLGTVRAFYDLEGHEILIMRNNESGLGESGLRAFSSVCPHLGCRVHWEGDKNEFFCPCHKGIFNSEGVAISGPPADAHQSLKKVSVEVDEKSQIVYIEVNKPGRRTG